MSLTASRRSQLIRIGVVLVIGVVAWWMMTLYSRGPSYAPYVAPARAFVRAALARDADALARRAAPAVVRWALTADAQQTQSLRTLDRGLYLSGGTREGDSTVVSFAASDRGACVYWTMRLFFVGARTIGRAEVFCSTPVTPPPGAAAPGNSKRT